MRYQLAVMALALVLGLAPAEAGGLHNFANTTCINTNTGEPLALTLSIDNNGAAMTMKDGAVAYGTYIYRAPMTVLILQGGFSRFVVDDRDGTAILRVNGADFPLVCQGFKRTHQ